MVGNVLGVFACAFLVDEIERSLAARYGCRAEAKCDSMQTSLSANGPVQTRATQALKLFQDWPGQKLGRPLSFLASLEFPPILPPATKTLRPRSIITRN